MASSGDELYFLACARHLDWGYVDHPPLIAGVTWLAAHLFGTSLFGLRLLPSLAGATLVWMTSQLAREFGWRSFRARDGGVCRVAGADLFDARPLADDERL